MPINRAGGYNFALIIDDKLDVDIAFGADRPRRRRIDRLNAVQNT